MLWLLTVICYIYVVNVLGEQEPINPLNNEDCKNLSNLDKSQLYLGFHENLNLPSPYEGHIATLTCESSNYPENCSSLFQSALATVEVVRASDGQMTIANEKKRFPENDNFTKIDIIFTLSHSAHSNKKLRCESLYKGIKIVSRVIQSQKIPKLINATIVPETQNVVIGSTFNITCFIGNGNDVADIAWFRSSNNSDIGKASYECKTQRECTLYEIPSDSASIISSVTRKNETDHILKWSYFCRGSSDHQDNKLAEATVYLKKKRIWPYIVIGVLLMSCLVIIAGIVIYMQIKKRKTQKSLKVTKARMELGSFLGHNTTRNNYRSAGLGLYFTQFIQLSCILPSPQIVYNFSVYRFTISAL